MELRGRVFARMWAVAALAHLAGNFRQGELLPSPDVLGVGLAALGVVATAVLLDPRPRRVLVLAALVTVTAVLEAPVLGNHWLLAALVSAGYLLTGGRWARFEPLARTVLVGFYSFAAFAKLNTGFLDPATSCGTFHLDQALGQLGLPGAGTSGLLPLLAVWGPAAVELAVPALLLLPRTRRAGVLLAMAFHTFLSLDLGQHFYDFTAVLLPLFALFLADPFFARLDSLGGVVGRRGRRLLRTGVVVVGATVTAANVLPLTVGSAAWLESGSFLWWLPYVGLVAWAVRRPGPRARLTWRLGPAGVALAALVVANGLTPYLELKSAYGWHMYANLVLVDGESNHLVVRDSLPLRDGHEDLVRVVASSDAGLEAYADTAYRLPWPSFRSYLHQHPEASVTYERAGTTVSVDRAADSGLADPVPWWWRWMPLRSVDVETPDTCQDSFLPAL
ncbi:hypothetical protein [Nocardioides solisilvae]|uniref:hypothetical protein n=1 Tax=Nocardioides solisilvae TaxID=1542435 RepID=UPI000D7439F4|nr:hypothetical protein [Nocardioides solisilvae]